MFHLICIFFKILSNNQEFMDSICSISYYNMLISQALVLLERDPAEVNVSEETLTCTKVPVSSL